MKPNIPTAEELRKKVVVAKDKNLKPVRTAGDKFLVDFGAHVTALLLNPDKFTTHNCFIKEMPAGAFYKTGYEAFLSYVKEKLEPLGYVVEQSHDGGGMYSTIVVRWNIVKPRSAAPNHRRDHGSGN